MSYFKETESYFSEIQKYFNNIDFTQAQHYNILDKELNEEFLKKLEIDNTRYEPIIQVLDMDSFNAAKLLHKRYNLDKLDKLKNERVLVLNMASEMRPGGGYKTNAVAQEEVLFYRSTYALSLEKMREYYPLSKSETIYSRNVCVFMDSKYRILDWKDCFMVSCIALPGIRKPKVVNGQLSVKDRQTLKMKIEGLFKIAFLHNHKYLVLGSLGCGVFCNPPECVAKVFQEVLIDYSKYFEEIIFAVLSINKNTKNYDTFYEVLL